MGWDLSAVGTGRRPSVYPVDVQDRLEALLALNGPFLSMRGGNLGCVLGDMAELTAELAVLLRRVRQDVEDGLLSAGDLSDRQREVLKAFGELDGLVSVRSVLGLGEGVPRDSGVDLGVHDDSSSVGSMPGGETTTGFGALHASVRTRRARRALSCALDLLGSLDSTSSDVRVAAVHGWVLEDLALACRLLSDEHGNAGSGGEPDGADAGLRSDLSKFDEVTDVGVVGECELGAGVVQGPAGHGYSSSVGSRPGGETTAGFGASASEPTEEAPAAIEDRVVEP